MSVRRSPPTSQVLSVPPSSTAIHYSSDSAIDTAHKQDNADNNYFSLFKRQKRALEHTIDRSETQDTTLLEIKAMFRQLSDDNKQLSEKVNTVVSQNQSIQNSISSLTKQYELLKTEIVAIQAENSAVKQRVSMLEIQVDLLERKNISASVEIRNIKKPNNEKKDDLRKLVQDLGNAIDMPLNDCDMRDIRRGKSDHIIVELVSTNIKDVLLAKYREYNKKQREHKKMQLNTENILLQGPVSRIYLSSCLTSKMRRLFYLAREKVRSKEICAAWEAYGKIYIKKELDSVAIRINDESDLFKSLKL